MILKSTKNFPSTHKNVLKQSKVQQRFAQNDLTKNYNCNTKIQKNCPTTVVQIVRFLKYKIFMELGMIHAYANQIKFATVFVQ